MAFLSDTSVFIFSLCFFCPASIQQRPTATGCLGLASRHGPSVYRSPEIHLSWYCNLFFAPKANIQQKSRAQSCQKLFCPTNKLNHLAVNPDGIPFCTAVLLSQSQAGKSLNSVPLSTVILLFYLWEDEIRRSEDHWCVLRFYGIISHCHSFLESTPNKKCKNPLGLLLVYVKSKHLSALLMSLEVLHMVTFVAN